MLRTIFLPIKPKYANAICRGNKKWEFRRRVPKSDISLIVVYSSSPEKKVLGAVEVLRVIKGSPVEVWKITKNFRGVSKDEYFEYFEGASNAYAYELGKFFALGNFEYTNHINSIPQSFCYCSDAMEEEIRSIIQRDRILNKRIFISGVHGVGKTTLLNSLPDNIYKKSIGEIISSDGTIELDFENRQRKFLLDFLDRKVPNNFVLDGHLVIQEQDDFKLIPDDIFIELGITDIVILLANHESLKYVSVDSSRTKVTLGTKAMQNAELERLLFLTERYQISAHIYYSKEEAKSFIIDAMQA